MSQAISSPRNPRVAETAALQRSRRRAETGLTLLEGPHLLAEAAGVVVRTVFGLPDDHASAERAAELGAEWVPVGAAVLQRIAPTEHPRGPVTVIEIPEATRAERRALLVLCGLGDPGNVGTLIRTAASFGLGVVVLPATADPWSPKVLRAAAGGHFRVPIERWEASDLSGLRDRGHRLVASVAAGGAPPWEAGLQDRVALLVGEEAAGLSGDLVAQADVRVTIPMPGGAESLNAAVAGSILAYESTRPPDGGRPR